MGGDSQRSMDLKEVASLASVAVAVTNEVTDNGVITALHLENTVWLGLTYGAWFKLGLGVALVLLIIERGTSIWSNIKGKGDK